MAIKEIHGKRFIKIAPILLYIFFMLLILPACSEQRITKGNYEKQDVSPDKKGPAAELPIEWKLPIAVPEGEFYKSFGWISDSSLVYASNLAQGANLYSYSLTSGKSRLILASKVPIVNVMLNSSRTAMAVHTSPSSYEAVVTIYDMDGNELERQSFPSTELNVQWNPFKEAEALVVAFNEDWSYQGFLMNAVEHTVTKIELPDPFAKYIGKDKLAYLAWDKDSPSLFAPIVIQDLKGEKQGKLEGQIYQMAAYGELLLVISTDEADKEKAVYTFYKPGLKPVSSFTLPHLSRYSDWLVPFQDYNAKKGQLTIFEPKVSGEADTYTGGFTLAAYHIGGERKLILDGLDNQPLVSSPNGEAFLYGYRFEKIIDASTKKVSDLIK